MKFLFLFIALIIFVVANGQRSDLGNWLIYFGNKQVTSDVNWHHEVQYRNYNAIGDLEQLLIRTGMGYNLTENNNNVLLGYGFIHGQNYIGDTDEKVGINEHRIFQQFITRQSFGRFNFQHRYRLEQRFIAEDFRLRFRYFLSLNVLMNNKSMIANTWYLSLYNELFLNTQQTHFDRNRLYGGVGYVLSDTIRFEVAYMNQFLPNFSRDQVNIVAFVNF